MICFFDFMCEYGLDIVVFIFDHYDAFRYLVFNLKKPLGTTAKVLKKFFCFSKDKES